jgi:predicted double-glycine peptidase
MNVGDVLKKLDARAVCLSDPEREVTGFYAGDFLSNAMGKAPEGCGWFTVMANVNVAGVAALAETAVVILCEGVRPDAALEERAKTNGINLIVTDKDVYSACVSVSGLTK